VNKVNNVNVIHFIHSHTRFSSWEGGWAATDLGSAGP